MVKWSYLVLVFIVFVGCFEKKGAAPSLTDIRGEEEAILASPPNVPPPISRKHNTKMIVNLDVIEKKMNIAEGVEYTFWTFGGTVPGSFIRIKEGDAVEFHLRNHPTSKMPHNIDLHAVTGQGGGAGASFTLPGHESVFSFRALNPGLYVYHCATAPVGMHIANGMYGLILVEPKAGLPKVDREYYVMQGDFYTKGKFGVQGYQPFDMEKAIDERPTYVVFNGSTLSLTGDNALKAKVGETVRLFVGNGGPNLVSSFHVIGEIFDRVHRESGSQLDHNIQTTLIPAGGAAIIEYHVDVPSSLVLVDHSIFRAFNKGALGLMQVEGPENKEIYTGKTADHVYMPEGGAIQKINQTEKITMASTIEEQIKLGKNIFKQSCAACHQPDGKGIKGAFPPLAGSDWLNTKDTREVIGAVKNGLSGPITVNGDVYNSVMPALGLSKDDIANVLTFIYSSWGNSKKVIHPADVEAVPSKPNNNGGH